MSDIALTDFGKTSTKNSSNETQSTVDLTRVNYCRIRSVWNVLNWPNW